MDKSIAIQIVAVNQPVLLVVGTSATTLVVMVTVSTENLAYYHCATVRLARYGRATKSNEPQFKVRLFAAAMIAQEHFRHSDMDGMSTKIGGK